MTLKVASFGVHLNSSCLPSTELPTLSTWLLRPASCFSTNSLCRTLSLLDSPPFLNLHLNPRPKSCTLDLHFLVLSPTKAPSARPSTPLPVSCLLPSTPANLRSGAQPPSNPCTSSTPATTPPATSTRSPGTTAQAGHSTLVHRTRRSSGSTLQSPCTGGGRLASPLWLQ